MTILLSGDIGGTKTLLQLDTPNGVLRQSWPSAAHGGLAEIVNLFLREAGVSRVDAACFALAGPVAAGEGKLTNLSWEDIHADKLAAQCNIGRVTLVNDFEAVGHGLVALQSGDFVTLQAGMPQADGVRLATGPGTGLGVVWLTPQGGNRYAIHPSEGGHADFAPVDELQKDLLFYLRQRYGRATYERVVSGPGLVDIFVFLRDSGRAVPSQRMSDAMMESDSASAISHFALHEDEAIARMALAVFTAVFGAFVGNLALTLLPRGGIYLAGGISPKIIEALREGEFLRAFRDKGRFGWLLETFPLHVVMHLYPGLLGAREIAGRGE